MVREGASVLMTDIRASHLESASEKVKQLAPDLKTRLESMVVDVTKEEEVEAAVKHLDSWGGVDVMFNNAGIMHPEDADTEVEGRVWDLTMNINVKGVWYGSKHAVASMRRHGKTNGSIINTSSMVAVMGSATPQLAYTASKGAVSAMTRELAIVHAREGKPLNPSMPLTQLTAFQATVSTHCVPHLSSKLPFPAFHSILANVQFSSTPLLQNWLGDDKAKRLRREIHFPAGRFGEAIEQAHAVIFLASDESSFVNATDFLVDGGISKAYVTPEGPPTQAPQNLGS